MTRVTKTLPKLTNGVPFRSISSSASVRRSSSILNFSKETSEVNSECQLKSSSSKAELNAQNVTRSYTTSTLQRPSISNPTQHVFRPLMQNFNTSAPKQASRDSSTIDYFFLPEMPAEQESNPFTIRVPLLPDNYAPHRIAHPPETLDAAIPPPEISIIAAHPESVIAAAMTEIVGNDAMEENVEVLSRAAAFTPRKSGSSKEQSTLKGLWNDVLDDVFGAKKVSPIIA